MALKMRHTAAFMALMDCFLKIFSQAGEIASGKTVRLIDKLG
jgi:hypothetical protein